MATEVSSVFPEARVGRADGVSLWDSRWDRFLLVLKDAEVHPLLDLCLSQEGGDGWGVNAAFFSTVSWGLSEDGWAKRRR